MPIIINSQTGLAEDLPQESANAALNSGTHQVPLVDQNGEFSYAPISDARQLVQQGYSQPSPEQLKSLTDYAKFSSTPEQIKTALEGAASGATLGLSTGAETALGANPEDIKARREVNPNVHALGEAAGIAGTSLLGVGEGALLGKAGALGAEALGLGQATSTLAKVGSAAVKGFIENALVSSGDEVSKMLAKDPNQTAETAAINIGLSGLMGGGIGGTAVGVASPLWKAASETKLGELLSVIQNKANGIEKAALPAPEIQHAAQKLGIELSPEINAGLSENPEARGLFQHLQESTTKSGKEAQASLQDFRKQASDSILSSFGRTPEQIEDLSSLSDHKVGSDIQSSLSNEIKNRIGAFSEKFENVKNQFSKEEFPTFNKTEMANQLADINQKYSVSPSSPEFKSINTILEELPNVKTLEDFRNFQSTHLSNLNRGELYGVAKDVKNVFRNAEENVVEQKLGAQSPELLADHQQARALYSQEMNTLEDLNSRLKTGSFNTPGQFLYNLKEMNPETLLNRVTKTNDANLLNLMEKQFPETVEKVRGNFIDQALAKSSSKAELGQTINPKVLFKEIDNWSPELKNFALPPEAQDSLNYSRQLLEALPEKMNPSGTAKTLDSLWEKGAGGAMAMASMLTGHNPIAGYVIGQLGRHLARDTPDAIKLATLKFLGSNLPVSSPGFKALAEFVSHTIQGEKMATNAVKSIFKAGVQVAPQTFSVDDKQREKIKQKINDMQEDPSKLMDTGGGDTNHYLPDEGVVLSKVMGRAFNYLSNLKPDESPMGILGAKKVPSDIEVAKYNRAIDIAQQPLIVLNNINKGTLTPDDIQTMNSIYPALYQKLTQKITNEMIATKAKDIDIPYPKKMALSLFLGQPLDNTMTAQSIQSNQPHISPPQNNPIAAPKTKHSMLALNKLSNQYETKLQSRELDHTTKS